MAITESEFPATHLEQLNNTVPVLAPTVQAMTESGIAQSSAANLAEALLDTLETERQSFAQSFHEDGFEASGKSERFVKRRTCAGGGGLFDDAGDFTIVQSGDDGREQQTDGDSGVVERSHGLESLRRDRGVGFQHAREFVVGERDRKAHIGTCQTMNLGQQFPISHHLITAGDDGDRVLEIEADLQAPLGEMIHGFDGLIAIGDAGKMNRLAGPFRRGQRLAEEFRCVDFGEQAGFEIGSGTEVEIFVIGSRVAVDAAVLAAAIGIDAPSEREVWAVVFGENGFGAFLSDFHFDFGRWFEVLHLLVVEGVGWIVEMVFHGYCTPSQITIFGFC